MSNHNENTVRLVVQGGLRLRLLPPYRCVVCQRQFLSERALSGHMRMHPDREWRGLLPPLFLYVSQSPTGNWYAHTPRGQGTNMMEPQQNGSTSVAIDLNEFLGHGDEENGPPRVHEDEENGPPRVHEDEENGPPRVHGDEENGPPRVAFDLNEFPEPEDDEI